MHPLYIEFFLSFRIERLRKMYDSVDSFNVTVHRNVNGALEVEVKYVSIEN